MKLIKNILLDLGNVIIPINPENTLKAFNQLGFQGKYEDVYLFPIFKQYEKGEINTQDFLENLQKILHKHESLQDISDAWNAMILDFDNTNFLFLKELKKDFNLFLVSNTNTLHAEYFEPKILQATQQSINYFFDKIYYSQIVGMRKPDDNIFQYIIQDANIVPKETLFVDDTLENIMTAKKIGFQTIHFTQPVEMLKNSINNYIKE